MRYRVLHEVARKVAAREPIDLAMGHVNVIWQGDANSPALCALAQCTAPTGVRALAGASGERFGITPVFAGTESDTARRVNTVEARRLLGPPEIPRTTLIDWTADWIARRMAPLGKDTHYDLCDGND
jgi:hypothetical protein